jgi:hypothetical protein
LIDGEPTRIDDTRVIAEGTERPAVAIERKEGSIPVAIDTCCACNEERHCDGIPDRLAVSAGTAPRFFHEYRESLRQESMLLNGRYRHAQRPSRLAPGPGGAGCRIAQTCFLRYLGAQNRKRARAFDTRALVTSNVMGNARKKSDRVSVGLRERTLAAHDAARISSPPKA